MVIPDEGLSNMWSVINHLKRDAPSCLRNDRTMPVTYWGDMWEAQRPRQGSGVSDEFRAELCLI